MTPRSCFQRAGSPPSPISGLRSNPSSNSRLHLGPTPGCNLFAVKRIALFAALAVLSTAAFAHGRVSVGVSFGFPLYYPYWYYPVVPVYYPPPAPPVYVEKADHY